MRRTTFWAATAAGALMLVGIAQWANSDKRALEAQASTQIEAAHLDPFQMMLNAKNLSNGEFEDFTLVFPSPVTHGGTSATP
jgi:hypothetical protein